MRDTTRGGDWFDHSADGTAVETREVDGGHLFHTYMQAVGIDSRENHDIPDRPIPIGDPATAAIKELLV